MDVRKNEVKGSSKAKAGSLYLFASIFNKGIAFLTIPIFTRILSTSDYGIVTTYSAWASILTAIIGMQLNMGIRLSRGVDCPVKIEKHKELSTIFTFTLFIAFLMFVVIGVGTVFSPISENYTLIVLCFVEGLFTALITDYTYYQMMEYKYIGRTLLMMMPNLIAAIISIFLIYLMPTQKYMGRVIGLSGVHVAIGLVVCVIVYCKSKPAINKTYIKWILRLSLPLILHGVALNILSQADRTMITSLRNTEETGIYSLVYSYSMVATVMTTGLEGIWVPWFTKKMNIKDYKEINKMSKDYIHFMTYAMIGLVLISPEMLRILAPSSYWEGVGLVPPLVVSNFVIFAYTMYVNVEYYYEKTVFITVNTIIAAIANIILNTFFIPKYGYVAAAFTTFVSYLISFGLHAGYSRRLSGDILPFKQYFIPIIHLTFASAFYYFAIDLWIIRWSVLLIYLSVMIVVERKRIGSIFPKLGEKMSFFR